MLLKWNVRRPGRITKALTNAYPERQQLLRLKISWNLLHPDQLPPASVDARE